jgi:putative ABC transport system permease protein
LVHSPVRTAVALFGVAFAVTLIFLQLGFLGSVRTTASLVYLALDFDLVLRSPEYLYLADSRDFPLVRLQQAQSQPGVDSIAPFYLGVSEWRHPRENRRRAILTMGVPREERIFKSDELHQVSQSLRLPDQVLVDTRSRKEFGPKNNKRFTREDVGVQTEISGKKVTIVDVFTLGSGFAADGAALMTEQGFARIHPTQPASRVSLGLVKLDPQADRQEVFQQLEHLARQVKDFEVCTRDQLVAEETQLWVNETPIGIIFQSGVVLACVVGLVIVYQVLSSDVAAHLREYATLKAMGYPNRILAQVVIFQAVILSTAGYIPGLLLALILYWSTQLYAGIPISMNFFRVALVLGLAMAFCIASGLGALWKVRQAEPADLF